jgi:predicted membrane protein (TIGR00267 family)
MFKRFRCSLRGVVEKYKLYSQITDLSSVSRRYFVIGFFDGALTILGLIMGAHLSGEASNNLIISAGIATALALGISSGFGAYEAEIIEQNIKKKEIEKAMLSNVGGVIDSAHKVAIYFSAFIHGIAPLIASLIPLAPYAILPLDLAFYSSMVLGFVSLFVVGFIFGRISKTNVLIAGLKFVLAGVITLIVITILNPAH